MTLFRNKAKGEMGVGGGPLGLYLILFISSQRPRQRHSCPLLPAPQEHPCSPALFGHPRLGRTPRTLHFPKVPTQLELPSVQQPRSEPQVSGQQLRCYDQTKWGASLRKPTAFWSPSKPVLSLFRAHMRLHLCCVL